MRAGIATNIATISGIRTYAEIPDNPALPAAVVGLTTVDYNRSFQRGLTEYTFTVTVILGRLAEVRAQQNMDAYISNGERSIKTAIESDKTLGGYAFDTRVTEMSDITSTTIGDITYLAADFAVTVFAN
jgi:hypothetical protein